jgi:putative intracellular protease/amidase
MWFYILKEILMDINCLVFNDFETLDLFGPKDNVQIITENINQIKKYDVLIIPGGKGTRILVNDNEFIQKLKTVAEKMSWCLTVCTGSALLAKTGLFDGFIHGITIRTMIFLH